MKKFPSVEPNKSLSDNEQEIMKFWKDENIFQRTIDSRQHHNEFVFLDGPPFATGTPHYGHILAGTLKDTIPRYYTMKGYRVERKWGWDCHGVPVEFQVEKEHKIGGKPEIEKMGIGKFNELCRSIVMRCREDWRYVVDRMGRFVDFDNDYKTMDPEFMESVWWVFGELWKKGLIYEGYKVVPYSPKLGSPLSNFEANLNYKDIDDPAVTVGMELVDEPGTHLLAWTTTPWTLPSNLLLVVHPKMKYSKVEAKGAKFIVASSLVENIFGSDFKVVEKFKGKELVGKAYKPLFDFYVGKEGYENAWQVVGDDFVSEEEGTGIVHMAPTGEEDARILNAHNIPLDYPFTDNCYFDDTIPELKGKYFRYDEEVEGSEDNANVWVLEELKKNEKLFNRSQIRHSYPHCWRTECALMYRGIHTWFVDIQKIKKELLAKNENINWTPEYLKHGRFGKGIETAPDWAISRNRYWGTPMPVWKCDKCEEVMAVTRDELEKLSGKKVDDLHRHFVDDLTWKCSKCAGTLHRIPEVLDCWFESGSMPYASINYPYSGQEFKPADFIAEGLDQTRCWFYNLHVLGVALFKEEVFKNVITNGIVLAEDGEKMSKSKKNYPDPNLIFDKYGADAMRFYLLHSPVARGENLRFSEHGVEEVLKSVLLPLRSAYQFFSTYANIDGWQPTKFLMLRHGESTTNIKKVFAGRVEDDYPLTDKGRKDIKELAKKLDDFDVFYASPFQRTQSTAEIIKKERGFAGKIQTDERLRELYFGDLEGKPYIPALKRMQTKGVETKEEVMKRMREFFDEMCQKHRNKTIAFVSHGGPTRQLEANLQGISALEEIIKVPMQHPGEAKVLFAFPEVKNDLDKWILSESQTLLKEFRKHFDTYDLEGGLRLIPDFIDNLNNWYLRRSRRRFWASEMTEDKQSGYETLHWVLMTLAKILAPVCPFFAEKLYQDLGGGESVHLEYFPQVMEKWIDQKSQKKVGLAREIVSLAASIRAKRKIKLRQPLQKLQFMTTDKVELDLEIIKEEANVKEVEQLKSVQGLAEQVVRVDAKKVGPRLGKKVQELIIKGKSGDFELQKDGSVKIAGETLSSDEFTMGFVCEEGKEVEATPRTVVLLDTEITTELKTEGMARELIRVIQEQRKSKGFEVSDRISITYQTNSNLIQEAVKDFDTMIAGETLAEEIIYGAETQEIMADEMDLDGEKVVIEISKL
ncbi:isoleucine--tRNA ligase [Candidatus Gracilibacteria bacterium]|nr:isoleucine--tRNA ligase [Candidatus Gracilibacteria bacterium]